MPLTRILNCTSTKCDCGLHFFPKPICQEKICLRPLCLQLSWAQLSRPHLSENQILTLVVNKHLHVRFFSMFLAENCLVVP